MNCKSCNSEDTDYIGIEDGGGLYGNSVCDSWLCNECGYRWEDDCMEIEDDRNWAEIEADKSRIIGGSE